MLSVTNIFKFIKTQIVKYLDPKINGLELQNKRLNYSHSETIVFPYRSKLLDLRSANASDAIASLVIISRG